MVGFVDLEFHRFLRWFQDVYRDTPTPRSRVWTFEISSVFSVASGVFSIALNLFGKFCGWFRGFLISSFFSRVSDYLSKCPKPAKPRLYVVDIFCFFSGVWRVFVRSGLVGKRFVVVSVGLPFRHGSR